MENRIVVNEFAQEIANRRGMSVEDVDKFINAMFAVAEVALKNESMVKIKGLGSFKLVRVEARESVNISTGQRFTIEGHTKISFTPDSLLRDQINKPFAEFETVILNDDVDLDDLERIDSETGEDEIVEPSAVDAEETPVAPVEEDNNQPIEETSEPETDTELETEPNVEVVVEPPVSEKNNISTMNVSQHIGTQHVVDMSVSQQHVEHQTIEPPRDTPKNEHSGRISIWEAMAMILFVVVMMAVSYIAGYNRWMLNSSPWENGPLYANVNPEPVTQPKAETDSVRTQTPSKKKQQTPTTQTPKDKQDSLASQYKQVEGSEFVIVGIASEHEVKEGESLRGLSVKYFGTKDYVQHIIAVNGFKNPDIIPLGYKLQIPQLEKRIE